MNCGSKPRELADLNAGRHRYGDCLVLGLPLVLCDYCEADLQSYDPEYFGLPSDRDILDTDIQWLRTLADPKPLQDWVCTKCERRLPFLDFLRRVRAMHAA